MKRNSSNRTGDDFVLDANFRKILEFSNEHIALTDAEGRIIYSNGGIQNILGYSPEEYAKMDLRKTVHPDDFPLAADLFRKVYSQPNERHSAMIRSLHTDGHYLWTEIHGTNLLSESDVQAIIFQMSNASKRMETKEQLRRYGKRMELLHQIDLEILNSRAIPEMIEAILEHVHELIPCEVMYVALYDWESGEAELFARSSKLDTPAPPRKLPFAKAWVESFYQESFKIVDDLELLDPLPPMYRFAKTNGGRSFLHLPLKQAGHIMGFLTFASIKPRFFILDYQEIGQEIANQLAIALRQFALDKAIEQHSTQLAEQVKVLEWAEQALVESETRYRRVVEDQTDLICRYTPECRLTFVNRAYAETFGETPESMLGQIFLKWIRPEDHETALAHIRSLTRENPVAVYEHIALIPDGTERWHQWTDQAFFDDAGEIMGYQGVGRDITERKRLEAAEQQERQFKDALLGALTTLNLPLDLNSVMSRILIQAAEVVPCDAGSIFLFEGDYARVAHWRGYSEEAATAFPELRIKIQDSLLIDCYKGSYIVPDTLENPKWIMRKYDKSIRSSIRIPIVLNNKVIGALSCDSKILHYFNESHLAKLEAFALYAGIALERVTHLEQLQAKVEERTKELNQTSAELSSIIDSSFEGILQLAGDLTILRANPAYLAMMQTEALANEKSLLEHVLPEDRAAMQAYVQQLLAERGAGEIDLRLQRADGSSFEAELSLAYVSATESQAYRFVATIHNISERKEQERQLRYHASLQENVKDAVIVTDMQFRIQSWNKSAEAIYGWRRDEVVNKGSAEILRTEFSSQTVRDFYLNELAQKQAVDGEYVQYRKDGTKIHIFASTTIVKDSEGKPFAVISVNRDISERKQLEMVLNAKIEEELEFQTYLKSLHEINLELSTIAELDDFYKRAVELGRERFGFERMGLLLYDEIEQMAVGTFGTDAQGKIIDERELKLSPKQLTGILGRSLYDIQGFVYEPEAELYADFRYLGKGWNAVSILRDGEKTLGWLAVDNATHHRRASQPLLDILALYAAQLGSSISQRRIALALTDSEERFRLFIEDAPVAIVVSNKDGKILLINAEAEDLLGYQRQELIGQPIEILVPETQRGGHKARREAYTENPHKRTMGNVMQLFARRKDGGLFWADIQLSYIETDHDMLIMAFMEDISERKLAEESLKLYADETLDLYNNAPCGYHSLDSTGLIVAVNDTELEWLGYEREEVLARLYFADLMTPESKEAFNQNFPIFKQQGFVKDMEFEMIRKDGSSFFISLSATAIRDEQGNFVMSRSTLFDISERKQAQQLLEQALAKERELGELKTRFVSMASHEFRTPLAVIKSSTDLVMRYGEKQGLDWSKQKLSKVSEQIEHLTNIMNDVLNLGRLQSGKTEFKPQLEDLALLAHKILDEFRSRPDVTHLFIDDISNELPLVMLDAYLMRQLINNLLSNAVKYSSADKPIGLRLWQDKEMVVLEVHDKGIGIPEDDLQHLFEPFHRAANVSGIQGTGMGLSITKEIAEKHGGSLRAESKLGQGTSMILRIPLQSE